MPVSRSAKPSWSASRTCAFTSSKRAAISSPAPYCPRTNQYQWFPRPVSLFTARRDLEWREVSGHGEIFSYTIANVGNGPFRGHEPYLIALVRLDEGVNIMANIVKCDLDDIEIGMEVVPFWAPLPDGTNLLMFQPAGA